MEYLYEAVLYLSIALLGTLVTVYVLSATLLSAAMNAARLADDRIRRDTKSGLATLSDRFATSVRSTDEELGDLGDALKGARQKLMSTQSVRDIIRVVPSVVIPGVCFLATAVLAATPKGVASSGDDPSAWWLLSFVPFSLGLYFFMRVLLAVETVVELATTELRVDVEKDGEPWVVGAPNKIRFRVQLAKGTKLEGLQIILYNHPDEFLVGGKTETSNLPDDLQRDGYEASMSRIWQLRAGTVFRYEFHSIRPRKPGSLKLIYQLYSDSVYTPPRELSVEAQ